MLIRFHGELLYLVGQSAGFLFEIGPPTFILIQRNYAPEVGIGQALQLLVETGPRFTNGVAPSLQVLRQPLPAARSFKRVLQDRWLLEHGTNILPDAVV
jgi:hypothetical protein